MKGGLIARHYWKAFCLLFLSSLSFLFALKGFMCEFHPASILFSLMATGWTRSFAPVLQRLLTRNEEPHDLLLRENCWASFSSEQTHWCRKTSMLQIFRLFCCWQPRPNTLFLILALLQCLYMEIILHRHKALVAHNLVALLFQLRGYMIHDILSEEGRIRASAGTISVVVDHDGWPSEQES